MTFGNTTNDLILLSYQNNKMLLSGISSSDGSEKWVREIKDG